MENRVLISQPKTRIAAQCRLYKIYIPVPTKLGYLMRSDAL